MLLWRRKGLLRRSSSIDGEWMAWDGGIAAVCVVKV
jgi:hypothetical protein